MVEKTEEEKAKEKEQKQKEMRAEINSKKKLYDKYELTRLRQKYIFSCQKEADVRIDKYVTGLKQTCEEMKRFKTIDED